MEDQDLLCRLIESVYKSVLRQRQAPQARRAFASYWCYLEPIVERYGISETMRERRAGERYWLEVATVHTLAEIVHQWSLYEGIDCGDLLNAAPEMSLYSWYTLEPTTRNEIRSWMRTGKIGSQIARTLEIGIDIALQNSDKHIFGEFYTPLQIATHILDCVGFGVDSIINGKSIVDPACGNGSLLVAALRRVVRQAQIEDTAVLRDICKKLGALFHGFDIQPLSVLLTKMNLLVETLPLAKAATLSKRELRLWLSFHQIRLIDPLSSPESFWRHPGQFDFIVGNPPFSRIVHGTPSLLEKYRSVIYGHVNLYQLFLWWAVKAVKPGGKIAFLVPQSMRAGLYSCYLRNNLEATCDLQSITQFTDRTGIFDGVNQPLMVITLQKHEQQRERGLNLVSVRVSSDGNDWEATPPLHVAKRDVIRTLDSQGIWCISNRQQDYDILDKVLSRSKRTIHEDGRFVTCNGGFVWNQHKEHLRAKERRGALPLISAAAISPFKVTFPISPNSPSCARQFVVGASEFVSRKHAKQCVLIQRTTSRKKGHRIEAALVPASLLQKYGGFFAENHLNVIKLSGDQKKQDGLIMLSGLTGWLNSRLLNFIFAMINGTSHVSAYELRLLPLPVELLVLLASASKQLEHASIQNKQKLRNDLDCQIYEYFGLTESERQRVDLMVP